jgi:hypothetical protein
MVAGRPPFASFKSFSVYPALGARQPLRAATKPERQLHSYSLVNAGCRRLRGEDALAQSGSRCARAAQSPLLRP